MPCASVSQQSPGHTKDTWDLYTHGGEDGLFLAVEHVAEWHLGALVLVDLDLRVVDVRDLLELHAVLHDHSRDADGGVGGHLNGAEAAALEAFYAEFGCAVYVFVSIFL